MFWGKRRFKLEDYGPYQDLLGKLQLANAHRYREFMMFAMEHSVGDQDVYVGAPSAELLAAFPDFQPVAETELPKVVDVLLLADVNAFSEKFQMRKR